ncbi:MAG: hypothetical protein QM740_17615 [Acidovorax sp.]
MSALRSRCLAWLLFAALAGSQWLGLVHGVMHAPELAGAAPGAVHAPAAQAAPAHAWLNDLFAAHHRVGDCRLYDHMTGNGPPPLAQIDLPVAGEPAVPPRWVQRAWLAAVVPLFEARAPPTLG